jgi:hypothetical protein
MSGIRFDDLSGAEQRLWDAFPRSELVDVRSGRDDGLENAAQWGHERDIRAEVIAALLLGSDPAEARSVAGLRLSGARVTGVLKLEYATIRYPVEFAHCVFDSDVLLAEASTRSIRLRNCSVPHLDASRMQLRGELQAEGCRFESLSLRAAHLTEVTLSGSQISCRGGVALNGDLLTVDAAMYCHDMLIQGEVRLSGAHISGYLELDGSRIDNEGGLAIKAEGLIVDNGIFGHEGHTDEHNVFTSVGEIRLDGAQIKGRLILDGAHLINPGGVSLSGDQFSVDGGLFLRKITSHGQIHLRTARVGGPLVLSTAKLINPGGVSLTLRQISVEGGLFLREITSHGQIRLRAARVSGPFVLNAAELINPGGIALNAERITVEGSMFCHDGFTSQGEIRLLGAQITGQLDLGATPLSSFDLPDPRPSKISGTVDLRQAQIGTLRDEIAAWPAYFHLDGLHYNDLSPQLGVRQRLDWLARTPDGFQPQPYEQLATYYRKIGHDDAARRVLLIKQRRHRSTLHPAAKTWGLLQDVIVGYGYRPWLAGLWLLGLLTAGTAYFAAYRPQPLQPSQGPGFNAFAYTLDLLLPIINLGQESAWNPHGTSQAIAYILIISGWVLATALLAGITRILNRN